MVKKVMRKRVKAKKGGRYACGVCGLAITVDNICGCIDACDIVCCGKQMQPKK